MARRSPQARAMLRTYREAQGYAPEQRDEVWARIEGSLDAGAPQPSVESSPAISSSPWLMVGAGALVIAAAAVVLALNPWRSEPVTPRNPSQAPHSAPAQTPREVVGAASPKPSTSPAVEAVAADRAELVPPPTVAPAQPVESKPSSRPRPAPAASTAQDSPEPAADPAFDELQAELILVQKARRALRDQRPTRALEVLDAHARAFPKGQMREDRLVLRIEALCAAGKGPQARAEARLFLRAFPASAHAGRVRAACSSK